MGRRAGVRALTPEQIASVERGIAQTTLASGSRTMRCCAVSGAYEPRIEWPEEAIDALDEIHASFEGASSHSADRFATAVLESVQRISAFPESGAIAPEFGNRRVRQVYGENYRIISRLHADGVTIETIVHRSTRSR